MSRPKVVILSVLAAPIKNIVFSQVDSRVLPASNPAAFASKIISDRFPGQEGNPVEIVIPNGALVQEEVNQYISEVAKVDGIVRVSPPQILGNDLRITAVHSMPPRTLPAESLVKDIRAIKSPDGTLIGGIAADYADKVAHKFNFGHKYRMLPFKGLYWYAPNQTNKLTRHIYPIPDARNPFLGVHLTVTDEGKVKIGPTAIPALWRENYRMLNNFKLQELFSWSAER